MQNVFADKHCVPRFQSYELDYADLSYFEFDQEVWLYGKVSVEILMNIPPQLG
jgi:hypothetical protein